VAPLGQVRVSGPVEVFVGAVSRLTGGDERTWYDGLAYERVCNALTADWDGDGDLDLNDFAALQRCITGPEPAQSLPDACLCFDLERDRILYAAELDAFVACASGPAVPADPACDDW
jgi:hypothetical protein